MASARGRSSDINKSIIRHKGTKIREGGNNILKIFIEDMQILGFYVPSSGIYQSMIFFNPISEGLTHISGGGHLFRGSFDINFVYFI